MRKKGYFIIFSEYIVGFKNPAIWLAESILAPISGTRFFSNMRFEEVHGK